MLEQTIQALAILESNGGQGIEILRGCRTSLERYQALYNFITQEVMKSVVGWDILNIGQLVQTLVVGHKLDFPVCPYFLVDLQGNKQFCFSCGLQCLCFPPHLHPCNWKEGTFGSIKARFVMSWKENVPPFPVCPYFVVELGVRYCTLFGIQSLCNPLLNRRCMHRETWDRRI